MRKAQLPWMSFIILALFVLFAAIMLKLFLFTLVEVVINIFILYFLFLRIWTELTKYKRGEIYAMGAIAALIIFLIVGNFLPVWSVTTIALITLVLVHLYLLVPR